MASMPSKRRNVSSGMTKLDVTSTSCMQPKRKAATATKTSMPQSLRLMGRLSIKNRSMTPYYTTPATYAIRRTEYPSYP